MAHYSKKLPSSLTSIIVFVGDNLAGKGALIHRYINNEFRENDNDLYFEEDYNVMVDNEKSIFR